MALTTGQAAPTFSLPDTGQNSVDLSSFRGAPVALVFVPFAFPGKCTSEVCALRDDLGGLDVSGCQVVIISCDSPHALRVWGEVQDLPFPLLSDFWPHGAVARQYGVFDEETGKAVRGTFLLDASGILRWQVVNPASQAREVSDLAREVSHLLTRS